MRKCVNKPITNYFTSNLTLSFNNTTYTAHHPLLKNREDEYPYTHSQNLLEFPQPTIHNQIHHDFSSKYNILQLQVWMLLQLPIINVTRLCGHEHCVLSTKVEGTISVPSLRVFVLSVLRDHFELMRIPNNHLQALCSLMKFRKCCRRVRG